MMNKALKSYLLEKTWLAAGATDEEAKAMASTKLKSGELTGEKYAELIAIPDGASAKDELLAAIKAQGEAVAASNQQLVKDLVAAIKPKAIDPDPDDDDDDDLDEDGPGPDAKLAEMEARILKTFEQRFGANGSDGKSPLKAGDVLKMGVGADPEVKSRFDRYSDTKTALTYHSNQSKLLGLLGTPMQYNGKEVNKPTDRSRVKSALWFKFQVFPELLTKDELNDIDYILTHEKFYVPNGKNNSEARNLTESEVHECREFNKNYYKGTELIADNTSGGNYAIPEFFDMDMIIAPTLASENIVSYVNTIPVPRGTSAHNFILGRPTIAAANTEGSAVGLFTTDGFITNHDTPFFRAAGFLKFGVNFMEDAHPRLLAEIQNQYMATVRLWFNEQIMAGDGTTEPQGVLVASSTVDVTPANPTTNTRSHNDLFDLLFAVSKPYRNFGGLMNSIYVMTETSYSRYRRLATGITGDSRYIFGENIESYNLFGHPVLLEEQGLTDSDIVFFQAKLYRLYLRQGVRFIREDRGQTLVLENTQLVGVDLRAGGQLDLGAAAAIVDSAAA